MSDYLPNGITYLKRYTVLTCLFVTTLPACPSAAHAEWYEFWKEDSEQNYHVAITAEDGTPEAFSEYLKEVQQNLEARPATDSDDAGYLQYRFEQDKTYLRKAVEARGYYQPDITGEFDTSTHTSRFHVVPGALYHFGKISLVITDHEEGRKTPLKLPDLSTVSAKTEEPANAAVVIADMATLSAWMGKNNCLFDYDVAHEARLDYERKTVDITYRITTGREATIGDIRFKGADDIAPDYLRKKIDIKPGDCFKRSKINDSQLSLQRTGLLAHAKPVLPDTPAQDGSVPVAFDITSRAEHTVKAGASYSTDVGPGVTAGWEHRNVFSHGEKLTATSSLAAIKRSIKGEFEKPYFLVDEQKLKLGVELAQNDSDAYTSTGLNLSGSVERSMDNAWLVGVGSKYGFTRIDDVTSEQNVALLSFPLFASQDKRDDALNPTKGWTLRADTEPFFDTLDSNTSFFKTQVQGTYYQPIPSTEQSTLAVRAAGGNILGVSTNSVPATERFYTGGAGSIRGYAYQEAGPLAANGDPIGGRSYVETSVEARLRVSEDYGLVTFIDGGNTFDESYPDFEGSMRWGAGFGMRYYTSFGPLRADIAFPLNKRTSDASFQLYFSIGQAF